MTSAQFELLEDSEVERVLTLRFQRLSDAGHEPTSALLLASRPDVDLQLASDLLSVAASARGESCARR